MVTRRRAFLVLMGFGLLAAGVRADQGLLGFSDERARAQRALEQRFDSLLKADDLREWMRRLSARPHHLGSPYDKENADLLASLFRSWGDRKSTRLNSSHQIISYAVFCLKKKNMCNSIVL